MANEYYDSEDVPFVYDTDSRQLWRMEGDRLIEIQDEGMAFDIRMNSMAISYNRAMALAAESADIPRPQTYIRLRLDDIAKNGRISTKNIRVKFVCHPGGVISGKAPAEFWHCHEHSWTFIPQGSCSKILAGILTGI